MSKLLTNRVLLLALSTLTGRPTIRNVRDVRVYIQEYPQYGTNPPDDSSIDLNDALYNDDHYTDIWKDEIVVLSGLIDKVKSFMFV